MCIFFTTRNRHSETQIDWQFFLGFICVGQIAISCMGAWLNPFESSDVATPTFWNLQILTMAKIYKVYGMVLIQPSVKQKPGIRMLINCERRSLDKEKHKEKRSTSQLWIILVLCIWLLAIKMKSLEVLLHIQFFVRSMPLSIIGNFKLPASLLKSTSM